MEHANNVMQLVHFVVVLLRAIACFVLMDIKQMNPMFALKFLLQEPLQANLFVQCIPAFLRILEFAFVKVIEF